MKNAPLSAVSVDDIKVITAAEDDIGLGRKVVDAVANLITLALARKRAHVDVFERRIADANIAECAGQRLDYFASNRGRRNNAANCRAFLAGLGCHLARHFLNVQVELGRARYRIRREDRHVERVRFGRKATDSLTTRGCACSISAVVFDPVNAIVSWQSR